MQLHVRGVHAGRDFGWKRSNGAILVLWYSVLRELSPALIASHPKSAPGYCMLSAWPRRRCHRRAGGLCAASYPALRHSAGRAGCRRLLIGRDATDKAPESLRPPPPRGGSPVALHQGGANAWNPGRAIRFGRLHVPSELLVVVQVSSTTCVQQRVGPCRELDMSAQWQTADNESRSRHCDRSGRNAASHQLSDSLGPTAAERQTAAPVQPGEGHLWGDPSLAPGSESCAAYSGRKAVDR